MHAHSYNVERSLRRRQVTFLSLLNQNTQCALKYGMRQSAGPRSGANGAQVGSSQATRLDEPKHSLCASDRSGNRHANLVRGLRVLCLDFIKPKHHAIRDFVIVGDRCTQVAPQEPEIARTQRTVKQGVEQQSESISLPDHLSKMVG